MKKRHIVILCVALLISIIAAPIAYGWFAHSLDTLPNMTSYVHKSYFESGDGTSAKQFQTYDSNGNAIQHNPTEVGCAFEIKYPVQLYYFAWLQALGYFNVSENGSAVDTVYFYLSDDLDMTGWVLPQIGTETYPFVGNFDGNGHTISNLTVQNIEGSGNSAWTDKPADINGLNIVGFFGVVGSLGNGGTVNAAVESGGGFTPTAGYTYNNATNEIKNFGLDTVNIKTQTTNSLAGIVAGYVNGPVSNVQVSTNGVITNNGATTPLSYTSNLSDYTLFGFVTEPYRDSSDVVLVKVDTPTETNSRFNYMSQGASAGWGGSIDMLDMFNRLKSIRTNLTAINQTNHIATETRRYDANGALISKTSANGPISGDYSNYSMYTAANDGSGRYVFSFNFSPTDPNAINYVASTYKNVIEIHETNDTEPAFYIQHNGTYLNLDNAGTGVTNTTPSGGNTKWIIDASNHIYTQDNDGVKYYLNANNNALAIGNTGTTAWNKSADAIRNGNNGPYLQYDNGWKLIADAPATTGYTIRSGNNYLNATGTNSLGTGASAADLNDNGHTLWTFSNTGNNPSGTISTTINGTTYYLRGQRSGSGGWFSNYTYTLSLSTTSSNWTNNNGSLSTNNCSIRYNNGWQGAATNNATALTITQVTVPAVSHTPLTFTDTTVSVVNRIEKSEPAEFSYFPLGASTTSPYTVIDSNTGYIIGGSYDETSRKSDIRISEYAKSKLQYGLTNTNTNGQVSNNNVRTVDGNGIHNLTDTNISNYVRYADAVKQFNDVLNGESHVYGLHFMDATISKDNLIVAPTVMLEGTTYTNYQMPEDSIDFLVHQKGYITFFAGTYFTDNNSFFSLHTIERYKADDAEVLAGTANVNDIKSIKEIKEIWKSTDQTKPYVYYLDTDGDGTGDEWSDTKTSDYSLVFNTNWITHPGTASDLGYTSSNNGRGRLFYFEIPVNAGEYALGSVAGRIGAYLLYLDIAANAQLVDRAAVVENFEETTMTYEYPVGATFQNTAISSSNTDPVIPSAIASLTPANGSTTVTITNDSTISMSNGTVNYVKQGVTVNGTLTYDSASLTPTSTTTTRIRRTTYYDYNVAKAQHTVTEVVVKQVDGGPKLMTINAWNTDADWDTEGANATQIATMTTGFTPNVGSATNGVAINEGASQTLDWVKDEANDVYCYLINVGSSDGAQTLRLDLDAFEGTIKAGDNYLLLYSFSYAIKDNDDATDGATVDYDFDADITFDIDAATIAGLYSFANRSYDITVTTTQTIDTAVVTAVTDSNYTVTLTPSPT